VLERRAAGQVGRRPSPSRVRNTTAVVELIRQKVRASDGRISAKRLLPAARTAGYAGSTRNFRRAVAEAKASWKKQRRTYRPWVPLPGQYLVIDWLKEAGRNVLCCCAGVESRAVRTFRGRSDPADHVGAAGRVL